MMMHLFGRAPAATPAVDETPATPPTTWVEADTPNEPRHRPDPLGRNRRRVAAMLAVLFTLLGFAAAGTTSALAGPPGEPGLTDQSVCPMIPDFAYNGAQADTTGGLFTIQKAQPANPSGDNAPDQLWSPTAARPISSATVWDAVGMAGTTWSWSEIGQQFKSTTIAWSFPIAGRVKKEVDVKPAFERDENTPDTGFVCDPSLVTQNMLGNLIFDASKQVVSFAIGFRQFSSDPAPATGMLEEAVKPASSFYAQGYYAGMTVILIATGIWVMVSALSPGGQRKALTKGAATVVFLVIGALLMFPSVQKDADTGEMVRAPNYFHWTKSGVQVTKGASAALATVFVPDAPASSICSYSKSGQTPSQQADAVLAGIDCMIYEAVIFDTWKKGQFGNTDTKTQAGELRTVKHFEKAGQGWAEVLGSSNDVDLALLQLRAQALTQHDVSSATPAGENKAVPGDPNAWELSDANTAKTQQDRWNIIREYMYEKRPQTYTYWQGVNNSRIPLALVSLIAALAIAAFVVITSVVMLVWHIALVLLFFLLPVAALLGALPPMQRFFKDYLATWAKAFVWLTIGGLIQLVGFILSAATLRTTTMNMGMKAVILILMLAGIAMLLRKLQTSGVADVSFTGQTSVLDPVNAMQSAGATASQLGQRVRSGVVGQAVGTQISDRVTRRSEKKEQRKADRRDFVENRKQENRKWVDEQVAEQLSKEIFVSPKQREDRAAELQQHYASIARQKNPTVLGIGKAMRDQNKPPTKQARLQATISEAEQRRQAIAQQEEQRLITEQQRQHSNAREAQLQKVAKEKGGEEANLNLMAADNEHRRSMESVNKISDPDKKFARLTNIEKRATSEETRNSQAYDAVQRQIEGARKRVAAGQGGDDDAKRLEKLSIEAERLRLEQEGAARRREEIRQARREAAALAQQNAARFGTSPAGGADESVIPPGNSGGRRR